LLWQFLALPNLHENEFLFRLSILGSFATAILMVYISFYLHLLFEKINKNKAKLMLILATISIPLTMGFDLFKIAALHLNEPEKIYVYLNLSKIGIHISSVMWGLWLFPLGTLVIESNWFPKVLGYLLLGSGIGYLVVSMLQILFPQFKTLLLIAESLTFGEVVFALWFIFKGLKLNNKEIRLQI